jgi:nucleobase:cation symporter-1, NCS1 family
VGWPALGSMIAGTFVGFGLVTSSTSITILAWQGYIFDLLGVAQASSWRESDLGVIAALTIGFAGTLVFGRARVRRQETEGR